MDFNLVCAVYTPNEESPELETLYFRDGCIHCRKDGIRYLDKYHTVVSPYERDVIATYIDRSTHITKYIVIIYIDFLKEQDLRTFEFKKSESNKINTSNTATIEKMQKESKGKYTTCSTSYRYAFYDLPNKLEQNMLNYLKIKREELNEKLKLIDELKL